MINENEIKHRSPESMNSIPKVSVELDLYKTSNSILNILNPDNTSKKRESVKSLKNEAIDQSDTYKKIMVFIIFVRLMCYSNQWFFNVIRRTKNSYIL